MKLLDRYILRLFLTSFFTVFVILFFIFALQTIWLFIAELAGKDLDAFLILKFLSMAMPRTIPLVLPLSILLASIMLFGSLAENYEFAAMKSSGISLQRAMRSLIVFIVCLSFVTFYFANNVIPYSEFQFINFRRNIANSKPALAIAQGQFSKIGDNFSIKVEKKKGEEGNFLEDITIHECSSIGFGNLKVIKAKTGEIVSQPLSNSLQLILKDGHYYEDVLKNAYSNNTITYPFAKSNFKQYVINIDLSKFNKIDDNQNMVGTNTMLKLDDLQYTLDSLNVNLKKDLLSQNENLYSRSGMNSNVSFAQTNNQVVAPKLNDQDLLTTLNPSQKTVTINIARGNVDSMLFTLESNAANLVGKLKNICAFKVAIHEKFVIAFSCILMFFLGAPLGAIIRKGGLGLPIVFAILIFISYHFINTFGKRLAEENGIEPFIGMWLATFILSPLAVLLTYRATNDIGLIQFDRISDFFANIFSVLKNLATKKSE